MTYKQAQELCIKNKIQSQTQYKNFTKSGKRPSTLPTSPHIIYKNIWKSWGEFLKTGTLAPSKHEWIEFNELKKFVRENNIRSGDQWNNYWKTHKRPNNIPSTPELAYKKHGWTTYADFFGTRNYRKIIYLPYKQAKKIVRKQNFKSIKEYYKWSSSDKRPLNIPWNPLKIYTKTNQWVSWKDFLGLEKLTVFERKFLPFNKAKQYVSKLNFKTMKEYKEWAKSDKRPDFIPSNPNKEYHKKGWISYADFIGSGITPYRLRKYRSFNQVKKFMRENNIKSIKEWEKFVKQGKKPIDIPSTIIPMYRNKGFTCCADLFGTENFHGKTMWMKYEDAKEFLKKLNLKSYTQYCKAKQNGKIPRNIPKCPMTVYEKEWETMQKFLSYKPIGFLPYKEAKKIVWSYNLKDLNEFKNLNLKQIPKTPEKVYKEWESWKEFLGVHRYSYGSDKRFLRKRCRTYEEAKQFARKNKITNAVEWRNLILGKKIKDLPVVPSQYYRDEWQGWSEFHGIKTPDRIKKIYEENTAQTWTYEQSREWVIKHNIKTIEDFNVRKNRPRFPQQIPRDPKSYYKRRGTWVSWEDFTDTVDWQPTQKEFVSYEEAEKFAQESGIKTKTEWYQVIKTGSKPPQIPSRPDATYRKKGWQNWGKFFGTFTGRREWVSYQEAKKFAHSLNLKYNKDWIRICKEGKKPENIPVNISQTYKKEFEGWGEFLGSGVIGVTQMKKYYPRWNKFVEIIQKHKIKTTIEYVSLVKELRSKGIHLPYTPYRHYYHQWEGWDKLFGRKVVDYVEYERAKQIVQKLGIKSGAKYREAHKQGLIPEVIPRYPDKIYAKKIAMKVKN